MMQACPKEIMFYAAQLDFSIHAKYIISEHNTIPDLLLRWNNGYKARQLFCKLTAHLNLTEKVIANSPFKFLSHLVILQSQNGRNYNSYRMQCGLLSKLHMHLDLIATYLHMKHGMWNFVNYFTCDHFLQQNNSCIHMPSFCHSHFKVQFP